MGAAVVAEMRLYALWSLSIFYFAFYFVLHGWMLLFSVVDEYFFFFLLRRCPIHCSVALLWRFSLPVFEAHTAHFFRYRRYTILILNMIPSGSCVSGPLEWLLAGLAHSRAEETINSGWCECVSHASACRLHDIFLLDCFTSHWMGVRALTTVRCTVPWHRLRCLCTLLLLSLAQSGALFNNLAYCSRRAKPSYTQKQTELVHCALSQHSSTSPPVLWNTMAFAHSALPSQCNNIILFT